MITTIFTVIVFLLILSFLVIIHELGHFITALWAKVKIEEFGIGYPPKAMTLFKWRGIPFTLNWLPFGGFVRMQGEDGPAEDVKVEKHDTAKPFYKVSKKKRLVVLMAGVVVNFTFGVIAFAIVYANIGIPTPTDLPYIGFVAPNSPAEKAGILADDLVLDGKVTGGAAQAFSTGKQVSDFVGQHAGEKVILDLDRKGEKIEKELTVRTKEETPANEGAIGLGFSGYTLKQYPWWQMPFRGAMVGIQQSIGLSFMILQAFGNIFVQLFAHGQLSESVSGPVGIIYQAKKMKLFEEGWLTVLNFAGMLSINLAILNALPIPALDGGRAFFVLMEKFIGSKRREDIEGKLNYFGFGVLLSLILLITLKDVWGVIKDLL